MAGSFTTMTCPLPSPLFFNSFCLLVMHILATKKHPPLGSHEKNENRTLPTRLSCTSLQIFHKYLWYLPTPPLCVTDLGNSAGNAGGNEQGIRGHEETSLQYWGEDRDGAIKSQWARSQSICSDLKCSLNRCILALWLFVILCRSSALRHHEVSNGVMKRWDWISCTFDCMSKVFDYVCDMWENLEDESICICLVWMSDIQSLSMMKKSLIHSLIAERHQWRMTRGLFWLPVLDA